MKFIATAASLAAAVAVTIDGVELNDSRSNICFFSDIECETATKCVEDVTDAKFTYIKVDSELVVVPAERRLDAAAEGDVTPPTVDDAEVPMVGTTVVATATEIPAFVCQKDVVRIVRDVNADDDEVFTVNHYVNQAADVPVVATECVPLNNGFVKADKIFFDNACATEFTNTAGVYTHTPATPSVLTFTVEVPVIAACVDSGVEKKCVSKDAAKIIDQTAAATVCFPISPVSVSAEGKVFPNLTCEESSEYKAHTIALVKNTPTALVASTTEFEIITPVKVTFEIPALCSAATAEPEKPCMVAATTEKVASFSTKGKLNCEQVVITGHEECNVIVKTETVEAQNVMINLFDDNTVVASAAAAVAAALIAARM